MASRIKDALTNKALRATHVVGTVNSWNMETFINGAVVKEATGIDNYTLGQIFYEDGEAKVKVPVTGATADELFVLVTPEERLEGELLGDFYNGNGERATLAYLNVGFTFETSSMSGLTPAVGDKVVWDITNKIFKKAEALDLTDAVKIFRITGIEDETMYTIDDKDLYQLTVIK